MYIIIVVLLLLLLAGAVPAWPYNREAGSWGPPGVFAIVLVIVLLILLLKH